MTPLTFPQALQHVTDLAQTKLPETLQSRLAEALTLVQTGHVWLDEDGHTASVHSRSQADVWHTVNGTCSCADAHYQAPDGLCAHRLAVGLWRRASELCLHPAPSTPIDVTPTALPAGPVLGLPEAPASVNVRLCISGHDVQWTLRDSDETRLATRLDALLARYPQEPPQSHSPGQPTPEGWCLRHATQMKLNHGKDGSTWYSHKTDQGWCKGKGGAA